MKINNVSSIGKIQITLKDNGVYDFLMTEQEIKDEDVPKTYRKYYISSENGKVILSDHPKGLVKLTLLTSSFMLYHQEFEVKNIKELTPMGAYLISHNENLKQDNIFCFENFREEDFYTKQFCYDKDDNHFEISREMLNELPSPFMVETISNEVMQYLVDNVAKRIINGKDTMKNFYKIIEDILIYDICTIHYTDLSVKEQEEYDEIINAPIKKQDDGSGVFITQVMQVFCGNNVNFQTGNLPVVGAKHKMKILAITEGEPVEEIHSTTNGVHIIFKDNKEIDRLISALNELKEMND